MGSIQLGDLMWLVGLFEGEGHFGVKDKTPRVFLGMTDSDVVSRAAYILGYKKPLGIQLRGPYKTYFYLEIFGDEAADIMEQFEPYLCNRSCLRVRKILADRRAWRKTKPRKQMEDILKEAAKRRGV